MRSGFRAGLTNQVSAGGVQKHDICGGHVPGCGAVERVSRRSTNNISFPVCWGDFEVEISSNLIGAGRFLYSAIKTLSATNKNRADCFQDG